MRTSDIAAVSGLLLFHDIEDENFETLMRGGYAQTFAAKVRLSAEGYFQPFDMDQGLALLNP